MNKQLLPEWIGIKRRDESSLLQKFIDTKDISYLLEVYQPYMYLVYGLAYKIIKKPQQSQDIVYSIFKELINKVPKQDIRVFNSWLYTMTREYCLQWRANASSQQEEIIALGGEARTHVTFYETEDSSFEEEINKLEIEIKNLKNEQRRCLDLFLKEQKCFQEIAEITGWDIQLIKRHIRNAKRSINIYQD